ncbi:hypothetical protein OUZ56_003604 [Daphnia magna]|uniref:Mon2/Sec7/BIG1-like HDS domain-containing protein n=1 Tax=Daphnia magna TaxID=35525 RepID=A0ABR0A971_9CRUS|nr:hypothetical protein OUZ56_003604 [Daphnia magna]
MDYSNLRTGLFDISYVTHLQHGLHVRTEKSVPENGTISRVFIGSVGWSRDHPFKPRSGGKGPTSREENDGIYRFGWETCRERVCTTSIWIKEPSLFAVAKLLATGLVNLNRVEVLWRPVTNHLLEVIIHPLNRLREWGIDVITTLVRSRLQTLLISPLNELSSTSFADMQQKQVDCVLHLLHSSGDIISFGWPLFLNIIGAINNSQGENSVRSAFQCLQLVSKRQENLDRKHKISTFLSQQLVLCYNFDYINCIFGVPRRIVGRYTSAFLLFWIKRQLYLKRVGTFSNSKLSLK